jgi:hypothetical protein
MQGLQEMPSFIVFGLNISVDLQGRPVCILSHQISAINKQLPNLGH